MKKLIYVLTAIGMLFSVQAQNKKTLKKGVIQDVETQKKELIEISDTIWGAAEIAFQETVSSETLIAYARANGFEVEVLTLSLTLTLSENPGQKQRWGE